MSYTPFDARVTSSLIDAGTEIPYTFENLPQAVLLEHAIKNGEGKLSSVGALVVDTGAITGRSPKDRFIVLDEGTEQNIWWSDVNQSISSEHFDHLLGKMLMRMLNERIYKREANVCAHPEFEKTFSFYSELAWHDLSIANLFLPPSHDALGTPKSGWSVITLPGFKATPREDGTRSTNFTIINFSRKMVLIGGTAYAGEIKKSVFSTMNYLLPFNGVLPMHCAANKGKKGDTALFFGLSGTGKTSLSADPQRLLVGDDEHGWSGESIFNFEGGCYAKCLDLTEEKEPLIFHAIKEGTVVENVKFFENSDTINFADKSKTENTRAVYPLVYIKNAIIPSIASVPETLFFLTADAFGVLPPVALLTPEQAIYHFLSGYTSKIAGTETGILTPEATFSACFGKAFLTQHPSVYANMMEDKLRRNSTPVWLINTGWIEGPHGVGKRIPLAYTRQIVAAILNNKISDFTLRAFPGFGFRVPNAVEGIPEAVLRPDSKTTGQIDFNVRLNHLIHLFQQNFKSYEAYVTPQIKNAGPQPIRTELN